MADFRKLAVNLVLADGVIDQISQAALAPEQAAENLRGV